MFEMFALLIDLLILTISDAMITCYLFSFYLQMWSSPTQRIAPHHLLHYIFENLLWKFATGLCHGILLQDFVIAICCKNLQWKFAAGICCGNLGKNLPRLFAVRICCRNLPSKFAVATCCGVFSICKEILFLYKSKSCLYGNKSFLYLSRAFLFVRFSLYFCYC